MAVLLTYCGDWIVILLTSFILHINVYHRSLKTLFLLSCKKINFIYNQFSIVVNVKTIYEQFRLDRVCFDHRDDGQNTRILVKAVLSWIISFLTPSDSQILQERLATNGNHCLHVPKKLLGNHEAFWHHKESFYQNIFKPFSSE